MTRAGESAGAGHRRRLFAEVDPAFGERNEFRRNQMRMGRDGIRRPGRRSARGPQVPPSRGGGGTARSTVGERFCPARQWTKNFALRPGEHGVEPSRHSSRLSSRIGTQSAIGTKTTPPKTRLMGLDEAPGVTDVEDVGHPSLHRASGSAPGGKGPDGEVVRHPA